MINSRGVSPAVALPGTFLPTPTASVASPAVQSGPPRDGVEAGAAAAAAAAAAFPLPPSPPAARSESRGLRRSPRASWSPPILEGRDPRQLVTRAEELRSGDYVMIVVGGQEAAAVRGNAPLTSVYAAVPPGRLRVCREYPVGTLRELFDLRPSQRIFLGDTAIDDESLTFEKLGVGPLQRFSFCSEPPSRAGLNATRTRMKTAVQGERERERERERRRQPHRNDVYEGIVLSRAASPTECDDRAAALPDQGPGAAADAGRGRGKAGEGRHGAGGDGGVDDDGRHEQRKGEGGGSEQPTPASVAQLLDVSVDGTEVEVPWHSEKAPDEIYTRPLPAPPPSCAPASQLPNAVSLHEGSATSTRPVKKYFQAHTPRESRGGRTSSEEVPVCSKETSSPAAGPTNAPPPAARPAPQRSAGKVSNAAGEASDAAVPHAPASILATGPLPRESRGFASYSGREACRWRRPPPPPPAPPRRESGVAKDAESAGAHRTAWRRRDAAVDPRDPSRR
ncbi:uncharacterized protein Tco025E_05035 [Trypanosoma conorhini]|uniref:Uncharacterized protein n=1 Tax=Trypanosoma conorhini TaxID=83891 RepID=A0A3S5IT57_9TRYP|nr:uncharacterized protein Tco025E_05035 [Trypanosoma conorhini]RNF16805.1 hypothetical protein Tco025E_05035 [Trypanosoma conorhini]